MIHPTALVDLASVLGISDIVRFVPPVRRDELVDWYAASTLVCVPSYNESFGLVAIEAQACATPVVAAAVGGLRTAVADGVSGVLVDDHDSGHWAKVIGDLLDDGPGRERLARGAVAHAATFSWDATVDALLKVYRGAQDEYEQEHDDAAS